MQSQLQLLNSNVQNTHKIFVKNQEEFDNFTLENFYDTIPEILE